MATSHYFIGYDTIPEHCNSRYCSDTYYGKFQNFTTSGNYDIFIAKPIDLTREPYDYYRRMGLGCARPALGVSIDKGTDTAIFCGAASLVAVSNTCSVVGPAYNYKWSNGKTGASIVVVKPGWYSVTQTSADGCFQTQDSVYAIITKGPVRPNISDNVVINTNAVFPKPIEVCEHPVILTGGGYGTNSYSWSGGMTATTLSITVTQSGNYCFEAIDSIGCTNETCVKVTIDSMVIPIAPRLICRNCSHDSLIGCKAILGANMLCYDTITNPGALPLLNLPLPFFSHWASWSTLSKIYYSPDTFSNVKLGVLDSGWVHIIDTVIGANTCDTLRYILGDSIYIKFYPSPGLGPTSILGPTSLCPGDSALLIAVDTNKFIWSTGSTMDSIWAKPGIRYALMSADTNSYGCINDTAVVDSIIFKTPPTIIVTPTNGVICPGDSLLLTCIGGKGNYTWQGPTGTIGIDTPFVYVKTSGSYYCIVTDTSYCNPALSNSSLITGYATPYLTAGPNNILCPNDTIHISVIASQGSTVAWLSPLSGSDTVQSVTKGGVYSCSITSCGIVTIASLTVIASTPVASIIPPGPITICQGDSVTLIANNGMAVYTWNPGGVNGKTILVKSTAIYTLVTTDSNGCKAKDSINVQVQLNTTVQPLVADTSVCPGETATLNAPGSGPFVWYSAFTGGTVLGTGSSFITPPITSPATFYVSNEIGDCKSARDSISVTNTDCSGIFVPNVFTPNGDGKNDSWIVTIKGARCFDCKIYNRWGVLIYHWNDISKGWDGIVQQTGLPASDGTYYYIINFCDYLNNPGKRDGFITLIRNQ